MNGPHADRESVDRAAKEHREQAAKNGVQVTHEQARERVARAVEQGDRKRENNHR
jgi:hypothetical protein